MPLSLPDIENVGEILIIFREGGRGGGGYPLAENSAKIINLIFFCEISRFEKIGKSSTLAGHEGLFRAIYLYFQVILGYNNRASYVPWFNYGGIFLGKMFDFQMANYNFFQFLPKMQIFPKALGATFF